MKKTVKKALCTLLAISLLLCGAPLAGFLAIPFPSLPVPHANAETIVASGACGANGDNLTWTLDDAGLLTISGTGEMENYEPYCSPMYIHRSSILSVVVSNGVTNIGDISFLECTELTSITFPDSVTSIGDYAFYGCTGITNITIPDSVTSIGREAFFGTAWLNNQPYGLVYAGKVTYEYKGTMPANTEIVLSEGTKGIAAYAFCDCTRLTSITIPNSVTSIGNNAFWKCTELKSINFGEHSELTSIGGYAFYYCTGLTSITIPDSVTSIGVDAFYGTAWFNMQPDGLVYAGKVAYGYKGTMPANTEIVL